jgi:surface antigen
MAIDRNKVKVGDLLLFRIVPSSSLLGKLIGWFSVLLGNGGTYDKTYGHVAVVEWVDPQKINFLEMTFPKSKRTLLDCNDKEVELWRIPSATPAQIKTAVGWMAGNCGKWYNIRHIISFGFIKGRGCADHVFTAYQQAGIILDTKDGGNDPVVSPNEISQSPLVTCIDNGGHKP